MPLEKTGENYTVPEGNGKVFFDISPYVRSRFFRTNVLKIQPSDQRRMRGHICGYYIDYYENYDDGTGYAEYIGAQPDNIGDNGNGRYGVNLLYAIYGTVQFQQDINLSEYSQSRTSSAKFLTEFESKPIFYTQDSQTFEPLVPDQFLSNIMERIPDGLPVNMKSVISYKGSDNIGVTSEETLSDTSVFAWRISDAINESLQTAFPTNGQNNLRIPLGLLFTENYLELIRPDLAFGRSEQLPFHFREYCAERGIILRWVNTLGGWEEFIFDENRTESLSIESSERYKKDLFTNGVDDFEFGDEYDISLTVESRNTIQVSASDLTKQEAKGLVGILRSPFIIYQKAGEVNSVSIVIERSSVVFYRQKDGLQGLRFTILLPSHFNTFN
jgi:hypothetical protein